MTRLYRIFAEVVLLVKQSHNYVMHPYKTGNKWHVGQNLFLVYLKGGHFRLYLDTKIRFILLLLFEIWPFVYKTYVLILRNWPLKFPFYIVFGHDRMQEMQNVLQNWEMSQIFTLRQLQLSISQNAPVRLVTCFVGMHHVLYHRDSYSNFDTFTICVTVLLLWLFLVTTFVRNRNLWGIR